MCSRIAERFATAEKDFFFYSDWPLWKQHCGVICDKTGMDADKIIGPCSSQSVTKSRCYLSPQRDNIIKVIMLQVSLFVNFLNFVCSIPFSFLLILQNK